jgi:hypothetical protein
MAAKRIRRARRIDIREGRGAYPVPRSISRNFT